MRVISNASKAFLLTALLGMAIAGCDRKATDQASASSTNDSTAASVASGNTEGSRDAANANAVSSGASPSSTGATKSSDSSGSSGSNSTSYSAGGMIDDGIITTKVKAALVSDSTVKGSDISVETKQGEVLLSGFAGNQAEVDKAQKIAMAVNGVKSVNNKMEVKQ